VPSSCTGARLEQVGDEIFHINGHPNKGKIKPADHSIGTIVEASIALRLSLAKASRGFTGGGEPRNFWLECRRWRNRLHHCGL
jgi:hypothetical protein